MKTYLENYNSTHYTAISGKKFFKIKEGDKVQIRNLHKLDSSNFSTVIYADRDSVSVAVDSTYDVRTYKLEDVFKVIREGKTGTVRATFPCNWCQDDLVPYKITGNSVRVYDLKLKVKWTHFDDGKYFEAYSSSDGKDYNEYYTVKGYVDNNGWTEASDEGEYVSRESNFWADALVRVIANIY